MTSFAFAIIGRRIIAMNATPNVESSRGRALCFSRPAVRRKLAQPKTVESSEL